MAETNFPYQTDERLPYRVFDADNHFYDPPDTVTRYIEPKYRELAETLITPEQRARQERHAQAREQRAASLGLMAVPGGTLTRLSPFKNRNAKERDALIERYRALAPAYQDRELRIKLMDVQGIEALLLFSTGVGLTLHSALAPDAGAVYASVRAFNRWVEDDWGLAYQDRIFTPAAMSLLDVDRAVAELEWLLERGVRAINLCPGPQNGRSPADPELDPFWARMNEAGIGVTWHSNWSDYPRQASSWSEEPTDAFVSMDAFQWFSYWGDRPIMETVAALIFHNLFGRFPDLKMAIIEHGTVWLPYTLRKLDHAFALGRRATFGKLETRPSEIFQKHFIVAPFPEENVSRVLEVVGSDTVVFGSDFPHPEGLADPILYATQLEGLSDADVRAIMRDNTARFLGKDA